MQIPTKYRRVVAKHVGDSFADVAVIREYDIPNLEDDEVLVKVQFVGINGGCETFRARGEHAFASNRGKKDFPLGAEGVGIVAKVGKAISNLQVGQSVAVSGATYAEFCVTKGSKCFPIPDASAEAVAVSLSGLTAAAALLNKGDIKLGETVLVTAAAGGTGHFAAQIAKNKGCKVVATCGSREKADRLKGLGLARIINYKEEDVANVLEKEFPRQIDVAYEGVGGRLRDAVLANLAPGGRVLAVGYISSYPHTDHREAAGSSSHAEGQNESVAGDGSGSGWQLSNPDELFWKGHTVRNGDQIFYGQVWPEKPEQITAAKEWIFDEFREGRIQPWTHAFKGLDSIVEATDFMLSGNSMGKVVVDLR